MKEIRSYLDCTQAEFAEQLGVCATQVHRWESGLSKPKQKVFDKISELITQKNESPD